MTTTATKTFFSRITWGHTQQEWVFTCDEAMMNQIRTGMLEGHAVSIVTGEMETIINPSHIAKLEFQPAAT
ncbi:MAG: hypothetical protein H7338_05565 [Candidatus Sericytochromatia bacterium]|nr:hypothetical protein [Candidatus Sericytochromatia bacterium]